MYLIKSPKIYYMKKKVLRKKYLMIYTYFRESTERGV